MSHDDQTPVADSMTAEKIRQDRRKPTEEKPPIPDEDSYPFFCIQCQTYTSHRKAQANQYLCGTCGSLLHSPDRLLPSLRKAIFYGTGEKEVKHPKHYLQHPSGVECIEIAQHYNFCLGNVIKYIWRAGQKETNPLQDLMKARQYLDFEIARLEGKGTS